MKKIILTSLVLILAACPANCFNNEIDNDSICEEEDTNCRIDCDFTAEKVDTDTKLE